MPSQFRIAQERRAKAFRGLAFVVVFGGILTAWLVWSKPTARPTQEMPSATRTPTVTPPASTPALPTFAATDDTTPPTPDTAPTVIATAPTTTATHVAPDVTHTAAPVHTAPTETATTTATTTATATATTTAAPTGTTDPNAVVSAASLAGQAQAALEKGQTGQAIALATRATSKDPKNAEAWLILGAAQDAAGNHARAKAAYTQCTKVAEGGRVSECKALVEP